jgi:tetratricopeptide (TPR) repeat protein
MPKPCRFVTYGVAIALCLPVSLAAQAGESVLQRHYEAAQTYQAGQDLERAAYEYEMFLTDGLGELAMARARAGEYEQAATAFDEALTFAPHASTLQLAYAQAALQGGDFDHARTLAEEVIRETPRNASAHRVLGEALLKTDRNVEARKELEAAVALDSSFANGYELAVACLNLGDEKCAAGLFAEMRASFGDTALLDMYFGRAYLDSDFQNKAVTEFQAAIAKSPRLPGAHYSLAAAYLVTGGGVKLAEEEIRKEIAIAPKNAVAYAALGHLETGQQRDQEAEADLKRAVALDPNDPDSYFYLGQLYVDLKQPADAEAALRTSIRLTRDAARNQNQLQKAHYLLGRLLMQGGDTAAGRKELQAAAALTAQSLTRDRERLADYYQQNAGMGGGSDGPAQLLQGATAPDSEAARAADNFEKRITPAVADSYNNLGAIAGSSRDFQAAVTYFQRAAEWNPTLAGLDENWGRAAYAAGQFAQAVPLLTRYLATHPDDVAMRSALGISQYMGKDYASARSTLQAVVGSGHATPEIEFLYADSLVKSGQVAEGVRRLTQLEQTSGSAPAVHRALGEALAQSGDPTRGAEELKTAIRLDPKDAEAYGALGRLRLAQGNATDAVTNLAMAAKLAPGDGALRASLAEASRQAGAAGAGR